MCPTNVNSPVEFFCPLCHQVSRIARVSVGRNGTCPNCEKWVLLLVPEVERIPLEVNSPGSNEQNAKRTPLITESSPTEISSEDLARKKRRALVMRVSFSLYAISFLLPGYVGTISFGGGKSFSDAWGWQLFGLSFMVFFGMPVWLANPLYWYSLFQYRQGRLLQVKLCMSIALIAIVGSLYLGHGIAYYVWACSLAMLLPAAIFDAGVLRFTLRDILALVTTSSALLGLVACINQRSHAWTIWVALGFCFIVIPASWIWAGSNRS